MAPVVHDRRGGVTGTGWAFVTADRDLARLWRPARNVAVGASSVAGLLGCDEEISCRDPTILGWVRPTAWRCSAAST
jgi:hypothetical protein